MNEKTIDAAITALVTPGDALHKATLEHFLHEYMPTDRDDCARFVVELMTLQRFIFNEQSDRMMKMVEGLFDKLNAGRVLESK